MASELTAAILAELKRLEKAATRPPWRADHGMNGLPWEIGGPMDDFENAVILADFGQVRRTPRWDDPMLGIPNAQLVAALRNHAPALIAAAERAERASVEVSSVLDHIPVVRVREGGGAENLFATLAISVANLKERADAAEARCSVLIRQHKQAEDKCDELLTRALAAEARVRELEEALKEIGRCDLGPSSADHLIGFRAAALARTALGKEPRT